MSIISFIFLLTLSDFYGEDLERYKNAYEYIRNDTSLINDAFTQYLSSEERQQICVSKQIEFISKVVVIKEIVKYEYNPKDDMARSTLMDCLLRNENNEEFSPYIINSLGDLNTNDGCKLKIFFTKIINNRLIAVVLLCDDCEDNYKITSKRSLAFISYVFYFQDDKIIHASGAKGYY